jgi:hypothetical protein
MAPFPLDPELPELPVFMDPIFTDPIFPILDMLGALFAIEELPDRFGAIEDIPELVLPDKSGTLIDVRGDEDE